MSLRVRQLILVGFSFDWDNSKSNSTRRSSSALVLKKVFLCLNVTQGIVICVNYELPAMKIASPGAQSINNAKQL